MKKITIILMFAALSSCKKNTTDTPTPTTKTSFELLTNKKWVGYKLSAIDSNNKEYTEDLSQLPSWQYEKDDYILWHTNYRYDYSDNVILRPGQSTSTLDSGIFYFDNGAIKMVSDKQDGIKVGFKDCKITSVSETELILEQYNISTKVLMKTYFKPL
jgi:hypothetical protein